MIGPMMIRLYLASLADVLTLIASGINTLIWRDR